MGTPWISYPMWFEVAVVATVFAVGNILLLPTVYIHVWWLPSRGVNGWTGEPKERYYELLGWTLPTDKADGAAERGDEADSARLGWPALRTLRGPASL